MNKKLQEYARLLVRVGLNVQKGQTLVISSPVECAWFARMCAEEAYAIPCREDDFYRFRLRRRSAQNSTFCSSYRARM